MRWTPSRRPTYLSSIALLLVLVPAAPARAHNGATALAVPVAEIVLDGHLSEWPDSLIRYPISLNLYNRRLSDDSDYAGHFRAAFSLADSAVYLAVVMRDESLDVSADTGAVWWNTADACVVLVDWRHTDEDYPVDLYGMVGDRRLGPWDREAGVGLVDRHEGNQHTYEWRLELGEEGRRHLGRFGYLSMGMDLLLHDRDDDGTFTSSMWGRYPSKWESCRRLGDLLIVLDPSLLGNLTGEATWTGGGTAGGAAVRVSSPGAPQFLIHIDTGPDGTFEQALPAGTYTVSSEGDTPTVAVQPGQDRHISIELAPRRPRRVHAGPPRTVLAGSGYREGEWVALDALDGLPVANLLNILADSRGNLWLATQLQPLVRYDGQTFDLIDSAVVQTYYAVLENEVPLLEDGRGRIWFASKTGGVGVLDGNHLDVLSVEDGLPADLVTALALGADGAVWIGTEIGLCRLGERSTNCYGVEDGLPAQTVYALFVDREGRLWVGTGSGVAVLDGSGFTTYTAADGLHGNRVGCIAQDQDGNLWFGAGKRPWGVDARGVTRYDGREFTVFTAADGLPDPRVHAICPDPDGNVWLATVRGLARYDGSGFRVYTVRDGLSTDWVTSLAVTPDDGYLWAGTVGGGLLRYEGRHLEHRTIDTGLPANRVNALLEDRQGRVWFGTGGGATRCDGDSCQTYTRLDGLADDDVRRLREDRQGNVWIVTATGATRFDGAEFWSLDLPEGLDGVHDMLESQDGSLYVLTGAGVFRCRGDDCTDLPQIRHGRANLLRQDGDGNLWLGTRSGLVRFDGQAPRTFTSEDGLAADAVGAICEASDGTIWVGTNRGLSYSDGQGFATVPGHGTRASPIIDWIVESRDGTLWLGSDGGLLHYDGTVFQRLTSRDGLLSNRTNALVETSEDVWIATNRGATRYRPSRTAPGIRVTDIVTDRRLGPVAEVAVPSSQPMVAIEFSAASLTTPPDGIIYLYRLTGRDSTWQQTRERRVEYHDLPLGRYAFEVRAVDRDLNYSEPTAVGLRIYHQPVQSSIHLADVAVEDIYASFRGTYERSIGSVTIANHDRVSVDAELSFYVPGLMVRPNRRQLTLPAGTSQEVSLAATLDPRALDIDEPVQVEADIMLTPLVGEQTMAVRERPTVTVFGPGALTWDETGRAAAFITPKDPAVEELARSLYDALGAHLSGSRVDGSIPVAMLLFEALSAHGVQYAPDASSPYAAARDDRLAVDHIQYPAQLLQTRLGDCDDCTVLYCSLLENLDVPTALVDAPGHILMVFDSGVTDDRRLGFRLDEWYYVEREGHFWIPVEVTKLGVGTFMEAWESGARTCRERSQRGDLKITDVRQAWVDYPSVLPTAIAEIDMPSPGAVEDRLVDDLSGLAAWRGEFVQRRYVRPLLRQPGDLALRLDLARTRLESGDYNGSITALVPLFGTDRQVEALILIGIAYAGLGDYATALQHMEAAAEREPDNYIARSRLAILRDLLADTRQSP